MAHPTFGMTTHDALLATAAYINQYGFSPKWTHADKPQAQCFAAAAYEAVPGSASRVCIALRNHIFAGRIDWCDEDTLKRDGWNKKDAVATLHLLADLYA